MALKRKQKLRIVRPPVAIEHTGFYPYVMAYNQAMQILNYSHTTLHRRESDLRRFVGWCDERSLHRPHDITKPILDNYQQYLYYYRQPNGLALSPTSRNHYVASVKLFFRWLTKENYLLSNPASEIVLPKPVSTLPVVLTEEEVERLLQSPNTNRAAGLRDRAILELLYSTGIRRTELCRLKMHDISLDRKTLFVRQGKGGKDRLLPIGDRACYWLVEYLDKARAKFLLSIHEQAFFLNDYGEPFGDTSLGDRVKRYMRKVKIVAPGCCHLLRHAMATHMLENGAEMRYIQAMLGHTDMRSTQVYAHVSIRKLQEIHATTHPAKLEDRKQLLEQLANEMEEDEFNE